MAQTEKQMVVSWMNDAHAMEGFKQKLLQGFLQDFKDAPTQHQYLVERIEEAEKFQQRLTTCLDDLGEKPARGKDFMSKLTGALQGIGSSAFADAQVKDVLAVHAVGHFAHICYVSLTRATDRLDEVRLSEECQDMADCNEALAKWALEQIPIATDHVMDTAQRS